MRSLCRKRNTFIQGLGPFLVLSLSASLFVMGGCSRSPQFKRESQYFSSDQDFDGKVRQDVLERAEKFAAPRKKLHVLAFLNTTPYQPKLRDAPAVSGSGASEYLGHFIADQLTREATTAGRALVPEELRSDLTSSDFFVGEKVRVSSLVREGRRLGVSLVAVGRIKKITYRQKGDELGLLRKRKALATALVEIRVFDIVDGKEILTTERLGDSSSSRINILGIGARADDPDVISEQRLELVEEALRSAAGALSKDLSRMIEKVSWNGRIARILGSQVYVNAGRITGLGLGDILKVVTQGEDIFDPVTGAFMGRSQGQIKGTLEIIDYLGSDGAIARIHSGGGFAENDLVQLY